MSTILFHSSPLVIRLRLHNAPGDRERNAQDPEDQTALSTAINTPEVPQLMLRRAPDRRTRMENIQQSA
jgi:hypothetical protein